MAGQPRGEFSEFYSSRLHKEYFSIDVERELPDRYEAIVDLVREFRSGRIQRVLEVGVESAKTGRFLSEQLGFDLHNYTCLDISETSVQKLQAEGIDARVLDISRDSLEEIGTFDLIVLSEVLGHLFDPDHALDEIARVSSSTGLVVITTPNIASWFNRASLLLGFQPFFCEASSRRTYGRAIRSFARPVGVIRPATVTAMCQMMTESGLDSLKVRGLPLDSRHDLPSIVGWIDRGFRFFPRFAAEFVVVGRRRK